MTRGPKIHTAENSRESRPGLIRHESLDPPSKLTKAAQGEYWRLLEVLMDRGTIDRIDLAVVAECARIKAALDKAHRLNNRTFDPKMVSVIGILTSQRRGLLRELGLTTGPSKITVRGNPTGSKRDESKWAGNLKVS